MAEKIIRKRRRYTDEEKAKALVLLRSNSGLDCPLTATANALQLPDSNLSAWATGRGISAQVRRIVEQESKKLADLFDDAVYLGILRQVERLSSPETASRIPFKDLANGTGLALDKSRLLRDQPTAITESRNDAALREKALAILERLLTEYAGDRVAALAALREHAPTLSKYVM